MATARLTSQARRAAILDAAVRLFSEKGFRGVTTRELAAAVGVSEPVLYQHFATKRELYHAIIEERAACNEHSTPPDICRSFDPGKSDRELLISLANRIIDWHTHDVSWLRLLIFSALEHHELSDMYFDRYSQAFFNEIAAYLQRRIADGAFRDTD